MIATHAAVLLYIGLTALLLVALSVRVSITRGRHHVAFGTGGNDEVERAVRAQGNFAEYAALFLVALAGLAFAREPDWVIHALGICFLVGRIVYAWSIAQTSTPAGFRAGRSLGMLLTWGPLVVAGVMLIMIGITSVK
jgi:uncharacterized membrane protein YecN with MAPEG domain